MKNVDVDKSELTKEDIKYLTDEYSKCVQAVRETKEWFKNRNKSSKQAK